MEHANLTGLAKGRVRAYRVEFAPPGELDTGSGWCTHVTPQGDHVKHQDILDLPGRWCDPTPWQDNLMPKSYAKAICELLRRAPDGKQYGIGAMYLEFENNGGAAVSPPSLDRDTGGDLAYFDALGDSPTRDFLRVPLSGVTLSSTDPDQFPHGNKLTYFAQTSGIAGVHGKAFSAAQQSRVYGGCLVATPEADDRTQDIIVHRFYFTDAAKQLIKLDNQQIGLEWPVEFS